MSLQDFLASLDSLQSDALSAFGSVTDADSLEAARIQFTGAKKGRLKDVQKKMGAVPKEGKKDAGMKFNQVMLSLPNPASLSSRNARLEA